MTLKAIYPTKFQSLYPTEETQKLAIKLWDYHLAEFSNEILNKALLECPNKFEWIPDLTDFKNLCKIYQTQTESPFAMGLVSSTLHEEEYKRANSETYKEHMQKCRDSLRGK